MDNLTSRFELDYANVLVATFELMLGAGIARKSLEAACKASIKRAELKIKENARDETGGLLTAALVLDAWHRDRRYLSKRAAPKAVRLLGPAPSVEAIVKAQRPIRNAAEVARYLKTLGLIVPKGRGRYMPASDVAVMSVQHPLVHQYSARVLATLLETVGRNITSPGRVAPLLERVAEVPDLPAKYARAFERFTQIQGRIFVRTVNDWLESRRDRRLTRKGTSRTVRAGVHAYAYTATRQLG